MDSGRFILAVVLMIAVMITTSILFPPAPKQAVINADSIAADSLRRINAARDSATPAATATASNPGDPTASPAAGQPAAPLPQTAATSADTVFVESPIYRYGFSQAGGGLVVAQMKLHESHAAARMDDMIDLASGSRTPLIGYKLTIGEQTIDLNRLHFEAIPAQGINVAMDGTQQLRLLHRDSARGFEVGIDYTFSPTTYLVDVVASVRGIGQQPAKLLIDMAPNLAQTEADSADDARHRAYVVKSNDSGIRAVKFAKFEQQTTENGPFTWVASRSKYFVSGIFAGKGGGMPFGGVIAKPIPNQLGAHLSATLLPSEPGKFTYKIYVGPQEPKLLEAVGDGFKDVNPFAWPWLRPVLQPIGHAILSLLYAMHDLLGIGYGWVLICFGILIRVLLWPLNAKAMRSQMKNMELQPRIKEIQARYKKEPEKLQKEMIKLYKEEGFNPMGGCLPTLIPFPILITLYFVFANAIAFRGVEFLWLPDLARADPYYILPVLLGVSMFVLQWFSMKSAAEANPQMKIMMYTMPPFMTFIFLKFASGLNLYYATMNLASIPQQLQIMRERERAKAARR